MIAWKTVPDTKVTLSKTSVSVELILLENIFLLSWIASMLFYMVFFHIQYNMTTMHSGSLKNIGTLAEWLLLSVSTCCRRQDSDQIAKLLKSFY